MKKIALALGLALSLISTAANASTTCTGFVTTILDYPSKCNGHVAYKTDTSGSKWMCALSEKSDSFILAAYASGKRIGTRIDLPVAGDCGSISNYTVPHYISIKD